MVNDVSYASDGVPGTRIRKAREHAGLNKSALARAAGVSRTTIVRAEREETSPNESTLKAIAEATGVRFEWLRTGRGEMAGEHAPGPRGADPRRDSESDLIRYEISGRGETGDGVVTYEGIDERSSIVRSRYEMRRLTGMNPEKLKVAIVDGPSMQPEIQANMPVFYVPMDAFEEPGIYVFSLDEKTLVKIVEITGNTVLVSSRNKEMFPGTFTYTPRPEAGENMFFCKETNEMVRINVVGRVVLYTKVT